MATTFNLTIDVIDVNIKMCFSIVTQEDIHLQSDITDHLVEDNTYVQDHIAIKPITYTLRGLVGEKVYSAEADSKFAETLRDYSNKLSPLKVFVPTVTSYVQSAINAYEVVEKRVKKIINNAKDSYEAIKALLGKQDFDTRENMQLRAYNILRYIQKNRLPVTIETGWTLKIEEANNFYITDVSMTQEDTYHKSDLVVTVKQLRFVSTKTRPITKEDLQDILKPQEAEKKVQETQGEQQNSKLKDIHDGVITWKDV